MRVPAIVYRCEIGQKVLFATLPVRQHHLFEARNIDRLRQTQLSLGYLDRFLLFFIPRDPQKMFSSHGNIRIAPKVRNNVTEPRGLFAETGDRMRRRKEDLIIHNHHDDGVDRRGFLKCMAWAGTGALYVLKGGILK